jgi:hypothetical protein
MTGFTRRVLSLAIFAVLSTAAQAQITLYENISFRGQSIVATSSLPQVGDMGFNDLASSAIVEHGQWQLCENIYFRGRCVTLGPGRYSSLGDMGLNDKVSSVRALGWTPDGNGGWGNSGGNWGGGDRWGSGARAVLYEHKDLSGRTFVVNASGASNLERTGFNDKASSLRVESGYWLFCSNANFEGDCRTFGPGDYPTLPPGLNNRISSGRQISRDYPYRNNPNWSGN